MKFNNLILHMMQEKLYILYNIIWYKQIYRLGEDSNLQEEQLM